MGWSTELELEDDATSWIGGGALGGSSTFFLRPQDMPQLSARLRSVPLAETVGRDARAAVAVLVLVASDEVLMERGEFRGAWYDIVRRRCCATTFDMPSKSPSSGEGVDWLGEGDEATGALSVRAVVGAALGTLAPDDGEPKVGRRGLENLEALDNRDAREPGRMGEACDDICLGSEPMCAEGDDGGGDFIGDELALVGDGGLAGEGLLAIDAVLGGEGLLGGDALLAIMPLSSIGWGGEPMIGVCASGEATTGVSEAWASSRDNEDGRLVGFEFVRWRVGNNCEFGDCEAEGTRNFRS